MDIGVLGPLRVVDGGREIVVRRQKHRALLALLALHVGEILSVDRLLDELWGERPPPTARNSLQNYVSQLRKLLGAEVVQTKPPGYVLALDPDNVDAARFGARVERARGRPPTERAQVLREALSLWRGRALADVEFEPFALDEAPRLEELRAGVEEEMVAAELELGRHAELLPRLEELVVAQPLRERLRAQLMLALYRSGRQADALAAYQDARRTLVRELGIEPGPPLRSLESAILRQHPGLDAPVDVIAPDGEFRERRTKVTALFAELEVPTGLDAERERTLTRRAFHEMRAAVEYHGGTVERLAGDELLAAFGHPQRHEDDALRATRAALQIARAVEGDPDLQVRIALDSGEVLATAASARTPVVGRPLATAKRLAQSAPRGAVLATETTHAALGDAVAVKRATVRVRGRDANVAAVRIEAIVEERAGRRLAATPLVGREQELASLLGAFERAVGGGKSVVVAVVGDAGIGKTRLARELAVAVEATATVAVGRCVQYGEGATWLPLREIVRSVGLQHLRKIDGGDRPAQALESIVGLRDGDVSVHDVMRAARRYLEGTARERPLLVLVDDLHWAEPTFREFVAQLAASPVDAPVLLLALTRPALSGEPMQLPRVELAPLGDDEARRHVDAVAADRMDESLRARIAAIAEGNPLFAEQLIAYVDEHGSDALETVPPTVEAMIASRLDRLDHDERAVLQRAAVSGREFWQTAVLALTPELEVPAVGRHLDVLEQRGLIHRVRGSAGREDAFRFHHVLIRDVAYAATSKGERSELHEAVAEWLETSNDADDEIVGYHLEQAYRCRVDVEGEDRHARSLALDAGERLGSAGIQAAKRADSHAAANLLGRACAVLPRTAQAQLELAVEAAIAERAVGRLARAVEILKEVAGAGAETGDANAEMRARIELANIQRHTDGSGEDLADLAASAIPLFEQERAHRSLARTWLLLGDLQGGMHGQNAAWADAAERAKTFYERAGWPPSICRPKIAAALFHGPAPAARAIDRCRELVDEAGMDGFSRTGVLVFLGGLLGMRGKFGEARPLFAEARTAYHELRSAEGFVRVTDWVAGNTEVLAGDPDAGETLLRDVCEYYDHVGEHNQFATAAADLAAALYAQDRLEEADELCRQAASRATSDDVSAAIAWRTVAAKIVARDGAFAEADELARDAVELAARTDALNRHGSALLSLAEVARLDDRPTESAMLAEQALALFRRKGNNVAARSARKLIQLAPL